MNNANNIKPKIPLKIIQDENRLTINLLDRKASNAASLTREESNGSNNNPRLAKALDTRDGQRSQKQANLNLLRTDEAKSNIKESNQNENFEVFIGKAETKANKLETLPTNNNKENKYLNSNVISTDNKMIIEKLKAKREAKLPSPLPFERTNVLSIQQSRMKKEAKMEENLSNLIVKSKKSGATRKQKTIENNTTNLKEIIIEAGDNWSHLFLPLIEFGELDIDKAKSKKLFEQFNKIKEAYYKNKVKNDNNLLIAETNKQTNQEHTQKKTRSRSKFFSLERFLSKSKSSNESLANSTSTESTKKNSSIHDLVASCYNNRQSRKSSEKRKTIDKSEISQPTLIERQEIIPEISSKTETNTEKADIKKDENEEKAKSITRPVNISIESKDNGNSSEIFLRRSNGDFVKILKSCSSSASEQTNIKIDQLKCEIEKTISEISTYKNNSDQRRENLVSDDKAANKHVSILEKIDSDIHTKDLKKLLSTIKLHPQPIILPALHPAKQVLTEVGVNTDISMNNAIFNVKYDKRNDEEMDEMAEEKSQVQSFRLRNNLPRSESSQFHFKPIQSNLESPESSSISRRNRFENSKKSAQLLLNEFVENLTQTPSSTLTKSKSSQVVKSTINSSNTKSTLCRANEPYIESPYDSSQNNTSSGTRTSNKMNSNLPALEFLDDSNSFDKTSLSLETTIGNTTTASTATDDLKRVKQMYYNQNLIKKQVTSSKNQPNRRGFVLENNKFLNALDKYENRDFFENLNKLNARLPRLDEKNAFSYKNLDKYNFNVIKKNIKHLEANLANLYAARSSKSSSSSCSSISSSSSSLSSSTDDNFNPTGVIILPASRKVKYVNECHDYFGRKSKNTSTNFYNSSHLNRSNTLYSNHLETKKNKVIDSLIKKSMSEKQSNFSKKVFKPVSINQIDTDTSSSSSPIAQNDNQSLYYKMLNKSDMISDRKQQQPLTKLPNFDFGKIKKPQSQSRKDATPTKIQKFIDNYNAFKNETIRNIEKTPSNQTDVNKFYPDLKIKEKIELKLLPLRRSVTFDNSFSLNKCNCSYCTSKSHASKNQHQDCDLNSLDETNESILFDKRLENDTITSSDKNTIKTFSYMVSDYKNTSSGDSNETRRDFYARNETDDDVESNTLKTFYHKPAQLRHRNEISKNEQGLASPNTKRSVKIDNIYARYIKQKKAKYNETSASSSKSNPRDDFTNRFRQILNEYAQKCQDINNLNSEEEYLLRGQDIIEQSSEYFVNQADKEGLRESRYVEDDGNIDTGVYFEDDSTQETSGKLNLSLIEKQNDLNREVEEITSKHIQMTLNTFRRPHSSLQIDGINECLMNEEKKRVSCSNGSNKCEMPKVKQSHSNRIHMRQSNEEIENRGYYPKKLNFSVGGEHPQEAKELSLFDSKASFSYKPPIRFPNLNEKLQATTHEAKKKYKIKQPQMYVIHFPVHLSSFSNTANNSTNSSRQQKNQTNPSYQVINNATKMYKAKLNKAKLDTVMLKSYKLE